MAIDIGQQLLGGVVSRSTPLISFYSIIDIDFGLINLIYDKYLDKNIFSNSLFFKKIPEIVATVYNRLNKNPLSCIKNDDIDQKIIDELYDEFVEKELDNIYEYSITTEILNLIKSFNDAREISNPDLLCYTQKQIDVLNDEESLVLNKKILLSDLSFKDKDKYNQIFVKDIEEANNFLDLKFKMFYISSFGPNFTSEKNIINEDIVGKLILNRNNITVYDIYKKEMLGRKK